MSSSKLPTRGTSTVTATMPASFSRASVVQFESCAFTRMQDSVRSTYSQDSLIRNESTTDYSCELVFLLCCGAHQGGFCEPGMPQEPRRQRGDDGPTGERRRQARL